MEDSTNTQYKVIVATVFGIVLANLAVALRLLARRTAQLSLRPDDYFICLALLFHWGIAIAGIFLLQYGLGLPLSQVSPSSLVLYLKVLLSGSFLYPITIFFTKGSILYLYHRTFPSPWVRVPTIIIALAVFLWTIVCCVAGGLICVPLRKVWEPTIPGACLNLYKFYLGIQIPNVITDIAILIVPIPVIVHLPLPLHQRWSLVGIFGVGLLTVIFDIVRLFAMIDLSRSTADITLAQVDAAVWTCVEPAVGILAACLSNMRPLLKYVKPKSHRLMSTGQESVAEPLHMNETRPSHDSPMNPGKGSDQSGSPHWQY